MKKLFVFVVVAVFFGSIATLYASPIPSGSLTEQSSSVTITQDNSYKAKPDPKPPKPVSEPSTFPLVVAGLLGAGILWKKLKNKV